MGCAYAHRRCVGIIPLWWLSQPRFVFDAAGLVQSRRELQTRLPQISSWCTHAPSNSGSRVWCAFVAVAELRSLLLAANILIASCWLGGEVL